MSIKAGKATPGAMVLLLGFLFSTHAISDESMLTCNGSDRPVLAETPLSWPHLKQKTPLTQTCWVSKQEANLWQQEGDLTWIDVRSTEKQKALPLEGALATSLTALENLTFLKNSRAVLVGSGFDQPELDQACLKLRQAGFEQIYALHGGILAKRQFSDEITPEEFLSGIRAASWTVMSWDLDYQDAQKLPEKPTEQWFSAEGNLSLLSERITSHANLKSNKETLAKIIMVTANNDANQQLKSLLQLYGTTANVLWLQGGLQGYQSYIQQQNNIHRNMGLSLQRSCNGAALKK